MSPFSSPFVCLFATSPVAFLQQHRHLRLLDDVLVVRGSIGVVVRVRVRVGFVDYFEPFEVGTNFGAFDITLVIVADSNWRVGLEQKELVERIGFG